MNNATTDNTPQTESKDEEDIVIVDKQNETDENKNQNEPNPPPTSSNGNAMDVDSKTPTQKEDDTDHKMCIDSTKEEEEVTNTNTRRLRRHKITVTDSEDDKEEEEEEADKIAVFSVNCELKLNALQRVFEGTHSKFVEDTNNNGIQDDKEPSEPLYCVCRKAYEEDDFMIMCDLCEEWYHGYCVAIKEDDAEDIEEYDCFLCCGYRTPCKGTAYNKLDPRNPVAQRFELAKKNRQMIDKQIRIESQTSAPVAVAVPVPVQEKKPKPQPQVQPQATTVVIDTQKKEKQKKKIETVCVAKIRKKKEVHSSYKRERKQFESDQDKIGMARKRRKIGPPPFLQAVPPLEMPDLDGLVTSIGHRGAKKSKKKTHHNRHRLHPEHPFNRAPSIAHAPPPLPHGMRAVTSLPHLDNNQSPSAVKRRPRQQQQQQQRQTREARMSEWRERIREGVRRKFADKIGVFKGKKLEDYLFSTYGVGSKVWNRSVMEEMWSRSPSSDSNSGNMFIHKVSDVFDKMRSFSGIVKVIRMGSMDAKDILYIGDSAIRQAIRCSDPNYKILCKLGKLVGNEEMAERIVNCAKEWSGGRHKEYVNKMRDLMYNLRKNVKLLESVRSGALSPLDLVSASPEQLANDEIVKQRRQIRENTLKERVLTENLDKLKRDSYHVEKSKILNFEQTETETDYDITASAVLLGKKKKKKKKAIVMQQTDDEESESDDDSDDDLAIAHHLKKVEYEKELKKRQIGQLLATARASSSSSAVSNNSNDATKEESLIIIRNDDEDESDEEIHDADDDIHEVKVIGEPEAEEEEEEECEVKKEECELQKKVVSFALEPIEIEETQLQQKAIEIEQHLIWKGKINHNEELGDDVACFGVKMYQIGGEYISHLPGFAEIKHKRNEMLMSGRIQHAELEKYILKHMHSSSSSLVCCKITISKDIGEAQKLIKHLKGKERCARFKMGHKKKNNYFDFYMIPPTKQNKYLNASFVKKNFNTKISNRKMWGLCVLPVTQTQPLPTKRTRKTTPPQTVETAAALNLLDDKFFTNLQTITSILGVDEDNNDDDDDTTPTDPRKMKI
eukprot:81094_1